MSLVPRGWSSLLLNGRLVCPEYLTPAPIERLPAELAVQIMAACESMSDLISLISSSPLLWRRFQANSRSILRGIRWHLDDKIDGDLAFRKILAAARLRNIHATYRGKGTVEEMERRIRPVIKSLLLSSDDPSKAEWDISLRLALPSLITDIESTMMKFAVGNWHDMQKNPSLYLARWYAGEKLTPEPLKLSPQERSRFLDALIQVDIYCNTFFHGQQALFKDEFALKRAIFGATSNADLVESRDFETGKVAMTHFHNMLSFVVHRHKRLMRRLDDILDARTPWTNGAGLDRKQVQQMPPAEIAYDYWQACAFRHSQPHHENRYLHYLCSQGLPLLTFLEETDDQGLRNFTLPTFSRVVSSKKPVDFFPNPPLCNTYSKDYIVKVSGIGWDRGLVFWDESRLKHLGDRLDEWIEENVKGKVR
ncbi:hypothetical protein ACJ41O_003496 [Fusarium nematophilum]